MIHVGQWWQLRCGDYAKVLAAKACQTSDRWRFQVTFKVTSYVSTKVGSNEIMNPREFMKSVEEGSTWGGVWNYWVDLEGYRFYSWDEERPIESAFDLITPLELLL